MGYRSNIVTLIYPDNNSNKDAVESYEALKTFMNTAFKEVAYTFHRDMEWHDNMNCLKFKIDDAKWYDSYPDVQAFNSMMEFFRDEEHGYCTEFIRIGEDYDDVETEQTGGMPLHLLSVNRSIESIV
jgi:hypothetical protein